MKIKIIFIIGLIGIGFVYWIWLRPKQIDAYCKNKAQNILLTLEDVNPKEEEVFLDFLFQNSPVSQIYETTYNNCLKEKIGKSFLDEILE